jgi:hypothetical protein
MSKAMDRSQTVHARSRVGRTLRIRCMRKFIIPKIASICDARNVKMADETCLLIEIHVYGRHETCTTYRSRQMVCDVDTNESLPGLSQISIFAVSDVSFIVHRARFKLRSFFLHLSAGSVSIRCSTR